MANICSIWIRLSCKTPTSAEALCNTLKDMTREEATLVFNTPTRPLFSPRIQFEKSEVLITGEVRWGYTQRELVLAVNFLFSLNQDLEKVFVTYSELGMNQYGRVEASREDDNMEDFFLDEAFLCGGITALAFMNEKGLLPDEKWFDFEHEFCEQALNQPCNYTHVNDLYRGTEDDNT